MKNANSNKYITNENFNVSYDLGHLLVFDNQQFNYSEIGESEIVSRAKINLKHFFEELFKLSQVQKREDEEKTDFLKPLDNVKVPKPITLLPRAKPIPGQKAKTRWEKYREEKGLNPREKRSRMVFNEVAQDWVPRCGKGR